MASFDFSNSVSSLRLDSLNFLSPPIGAASIRSSSSFTHDFVDFKTYSGSGFTYDVNGNPVGGTINAITFSSDPAGPPPHGSWQVSGLSMTIPEWRQYLLAPADAALAAILVGNDAITGSKFGDLIRGFHGD